MVSPVCGAFSRTANGRAGRRFGRIAVAPAPVIADRLARRALGGAHLLQLLASVA